METVVRVWDQPGGGRVVEVPATRLARFVSGIEARHGPIVTTRYGASDVTLIAEDGETVRLAPLIASFDATEATGLLLAPLEEALQTPRKVGLLLVRAGGFSVGCVEGPAIHPHLVTSLTGRRHVQGRTAAGGWSQQRYARRRAGQRARAFDAAADAVSRVLSGKDLTTLVAGGDRAAVAEVLAHRGKAEFSRLLHPRFLDVPEPRRAVLEDAVTRAHAIWAHFDG